MEILLLILLVGGVIVLVGKSSDHTRQSSEPRRRNSQSPPFARAKLVDSKSSDLKLPVMPANRRISGRAHIIDGDTIAIQRVKIRLSGIDAPELDMPWGQKSKWALVAICKGQVITAKLDGERSFDRLVGTCYLPDGRDIGAEIVKTGLALDLPHFSGGKYRQYEPEGARKKLCNGKFGHSSIKRT